MYPQSYLRYYLLLKTVVKLAKIHVLFNFYKLEQNNDWKHASKNSNLYHKKDWGTFLIDYA